MNILGIALFACFGFVLADGGITISDKPVHFLIILILALLIEYNGRFFERTYNGKKDGS